MSQDTSPNGSYADSADLAGRRDALRRAAERPGSEARVLLEAACAELDAAVDTTAAMTRRMDMVTAVTGLLLDNSTFSEAVTVQRCARLLAGKIASWVIIDIERSGELRRQIATGPPGEQPDELARTVRDVDPPPGSAPDRAHATACPVMVARRSAGPGRRRGPRHRSGRDAAARAARRGRAARASRSRTETTATAC